jgi:hypothetical protein
MHRSETRERVSALLETGASITEIAQRLGISKPTVCYHKRKLGYRMDGRFACRYDWSAVQEYYDRGHSKRRGEERFGFSAWAWSYAVKRGAIVPRPKAMPLEELLVVNAKRGRWNIRRRLIAEGLKDNRCENCGISNWHGNCCQWLFTTEMGTAWTTGSRISSCSVPTATVRLRTSARKTGPGGGSPSHASATYGSPASYRTGCALQPPPAGR